MWKLDDFNIGTSWRSTGSSTQALNAAPQAVERTCSDQAEKALSEKNYARLDAYSRAAWGYEARAYPDVQKTARDVVKGLMFYLALLLPFAFFTERLVIASRSSSSRSSGSSRSSSRPSSCSASSIRRSTSR